MLPRTSVVAVSSALTKMSAPAGAKMYGAFWCTHCYDQKQDFGMEAMSDFPYVECYPEGVHQAWKTAALWFASAAIPYAYIL